MPSKFTFVTLISNLFKMKRLITLTLMLTGFITWATNHQVAVSSNVFTPSSLTIMVGDTVTWNNTSGSHNVDGRTATYPANPASFYSGSASGSMWTYSYTFTTAGSYTYDCTPHVGFGMVGTVTVNAAATPPVPCSDLFFSEYIEGGGNNKALEIYNPTNASINLTGYSIAMFSNGATSANSTFALYGSLASGDVFVISADQASAAVLNAADTAVPWPSVVHYNGNDAVVLLNSTNDTLDAIGVVGVDPGSSGWTVGTGTTKDNTLVRMITTDSGTKDWTIGSMQWDVYPKDTTMFIGSHVSNCHSASASCNELFFSEYIEGGGNNKALEIYNPTNASINLTGYSIAMFSNGATSANSTFALYGSLASGDVFVISADQASAAVLNAADTAVPWPSVVHYNGNDAVILLNSTNDTLDAVGVVGVDPGSSGWTVGSGSTKDNTLVRKITADAGTKDWTVGTGQWDVYPKDTTMFLGAHTSTCISGPIPPTVSFTSAGQTHLEDAGTQPVYMTINPVSTNAEIVQVYVMEGNNITSGDYTLNPAAVMDTLTFNPAAGDDT